MYTHTTPMKTARTRRRRGLTATLATGLAVTGIAATAVPPAFAAGGPPQPIDPISFVLPGTDFPPDFGCPGFQTQVDITSLDKVAAMNLHVFKEIDPQYRVTLTNLTNGNTITVQSQSSYHVSFKDLPDGTVDITQAVTGPTVGLRPLRVQDGVNTFEGIWTSRDSFNNGDDPIQVVQDTNNGGVRQLCPLIA